MSRIRNTDFFRFTLRWPSHEELGIVRTGQRGFRLFDMMTKHFFGISDDKSKVEITQ
jgi:hypothetical protein